MVNLFSVPNISFQCNYVLQIGRISLKNVDVLNVGARKRFGFKHSLLYDESSYNCMYTIHVLVSFLNMC